MAIEPQMPHPSATASGQARTDEREPGECESASSFPERKSREAIFRGGKTLLAPLLPHPGQQLSSERERKRPRRLRPRVLQAQPTHNARPGSVQAVRTEPRLAQLAERTVRRRLDTDEPPDVSIPCPQLPRPPETVMLKVQRSGLKLFGIHSR